MFFIQPNNENKLADKDKLIDGVDRTSAQMVAYQLGWLILVLDRGNQGHLEIAKQDIQELTALLLYSQGTLSA